MYRYLKTKIFLGYNKSTKIFNTVCCFFFFICYSLAQQPAYFLLGEKEFSGIHIYDVIQDHNSNYYFSTNDGLFLYDFYNYTSIECDQSKSNSYFNFVKDSNGVIYCNNLNYQVFKIENKECKLFYELKEDEKREDVYLAVTEDNHLLISSRKIIVLDSNKKLITKSPKLRYIGSPFITATNEVHFHLLALDTIVVYSNKTFHFKKLNGLTNKKPLVGVFRFFYFNQKEYAINLTTKETYRYSPSKYSLEMIEVDNLFSRSQFTRIYELNNAIWFASTLPGISYFQSSLSQNNLFYHTYYISDVYQDNEGNILLSTFDKGVIVIPDIKVSGVINEFKEDPIVSLQTDQQLGLLMGSSTGKIFQYKDGQIKIFNNTGKHPIEVIKSDKNSNIMIYDNGTIMMYHKKNHSTIELLDASLKDAIIISDSLFYLGTNRALYQCKLNNNNKYHVSRVSGMRKRIYSLARISSPDILYVASSDGLFAMHNDSSQYPIVYHSESIYPLAMCTEKKYLFVSTQKDGILVIKDTNVVYRIQPQIDEKIISLKKIQIVNNSIIGQISNGLWQFDFTGKLTKSIHSIFGFSSKHVNDFTYDNKHLWVSHTSGVQKVNLQYQHTKQNKLTINLTDIYVNDESINSKYRTIFKSNESKFKFVISCPTLNNRETIKYHFQLEGYENKWNVNPYDENEIIYNALSPGDYTFVVKAENYGIYSNIITYTFTIKPPFYARWWFVSAIILVFFTIVYLAYRWQLNIQNKKSEKKAELNASKLTAIQSQMNPHFIFNSLNSIQDLVLRKETEKSYDYIVKFSTLVRQTLNYSSKEFIEFDEEVNLLRIYLELEQLRFQDKFKYNIEIFNVEEIEVPPLLIQPFVENAIKHGLLHKSGEKILNIVFEQTNILTCTITDNGVGRKKAQEIKDRQKKTYDSFSVKAIKNRFEILQDIYKSELGVEYIDLIKDNMPVGTKIILKIPFKNKY